MWARALSLGGIYGASARMQAQPGLAAAPMCPTFNVALGESARQGEIGEDLPEIVSRRLRPGQEVAEMRYIHVLAPAFAMTAYVTMMTVLLMSP